MNKIATIEVLKNENTKLKERIQDMNAKLIK